MTATETPMSPEDFAQPFQICAGCYKPVGGKTGRRYITETAPGEIQGRTRRFHFCDPPCQGRRHQVADDVLRAISSGDEPWWERAAARFVRVIGWRESDRVILRWPTGTEMPASILGRDPNLADYWRLELDGPKPAFATVPARWLRPIKIDLATAAGEVLDSAEGIGPCGCPRGLPEPHQAGCSEYQDPLEELGS